MIPSTLLVLFFSLAVLAVAIPSEDCKPGPGHKPADDAGADATPSGVPGRRPSNGRTNATVSVNGRHRNILYVTNWSIYGASYNPDDIPIDQITHVMYAFADIQPNGTVVSSDPWADTGKPFGKDNPAEPGHNAYGLVKQLYMKKMANRQLKVILSVGGFNWSPKITPIIADDKLRANFVASSIKLVADHGFDGLDIDYEYPNTTEKSTNTVKLLSELRAGLNQYSAQHANGYHFTLGFPGPAGPQNYAALDFKGMDRSLDFWSLMGFDFAGAWENTTGHQSNVYASKRNPLSTRASIDQAVKDYTKAGIPAVKINLGMPLYGRAFNSTAGMGRAYGGLPNGTLDQPGLWTYKDLPRPGARVMWDDVVKATWSYDNRTQQLVTYDDLKSALYKQEYIKKKKLGGAMFWEASGDKMGEESIVRNMATWMGKLERSKNLISYPVSQYDNIRNNMQSSNATKPQTGGPLLARKKSFASWLYLAGH